MQGHPEESHRLTDKIEIKNSRPLKLSKKISTEKEVTVKPAVEENFAECRQKYDILGVDSC
jgi:hypothetical protein